MGIYNLESVWEMAEDDDAFVKMIVQTFLEEIPPDLEEMNQALKARDAKATYQKAHKMKPNLLMFGLDLLGEITILESWAKRGEETDKVDEAAAQITATVGQAEKELKADFNL